MEHRLQGAGAAPAPLQTPGGNRLCHVLAIFSVTVPAGDGNARVGTLIGVKQFENKRGQGGAAFGGAAAAFTGRNISAAAGEPGGRGRLQPPRLPSAPLRFPISGRPPLPAGPPRPAGLP